LGEPTAVFSGPEGEEVIVDVSSRKDVVQFHKILTMHDATKGRAVAFSLSEESDGFRRLLNLLPALYRVKAGGGVFVVDELERSMHPMLARKFIEFFLNVADVARSQLIFTTHESTLLDQDLMRRDAIWFAEKDDAGASHLYSLADFHVRTDLDIEKGYFAGRFGAVPFLGGIDRLIEQQADAVECEA
jgi:AAA15 family ATPase/GTPase